MASTQKSLRLLRNATLYTSKALAYNALRDMANVEDGVPVLARYTEAGKEKTLLGLYSKIADGTKHMTIFDFDSDAREALEQRIQTISGNITNAIEEAIQALDVDTITAGDGEFIKSVGEADGKITATTGEMPTVAAISEAGKPIVSVSQTKGTVGATAGNINAEYVNVTGSVFSSSTVQGALEKIETEYKAADTALKNEILGGATDSANTLGELETLINNLSADAKEYQIKKIETGLSENVKEAWGLFDQDDNQSGATINIYKDSAYKEIYLGTSADTINATTGEITKQDGDKQSLNYAYMKADGSYDLVKVDVSAFLSEDEFQSGLTVTNHIVHGVVDPTSENFLSVGAAGFKLSGVRSAIDSAVTTAVQALDVTGDTAVAGQYVAAIEETDGVVAVKTRANVSEAVLNNYAKGTKPSDLAVASTDTINQAIAKLEHQVDDAKSQAQASKTIVQGGTDNSHLKISSAIPEGSSAVTYTITLTDVASETALTAEIAARKAVDGQDGQTYAANTGANYISDATSLNDADVKLDTALSSVSGKVDTLSGKSITGIDMTGGTAAITANTDGTKKITINADATTVSANTITGGKGIAAGSVQDVLQSIYDNVNANKVVGSNAITTGASAGNTQVSLKLDSTHTDNKLTDAENQYSANRNALKITNDGLFLSDVWDAGTY